MDLLISDMISNVDVEQYFDSKKKVYGSVPVFPFLMQDQIEKAIEALINVEEIKKEVANIEKNASDSRIPETDFIISLLGWNDYPEITKLLTIIREWAFRNEGGGTGARDFDAFDEKDFMKQLVILNPSFESVLEIIIGGYRFAIHDEETYEKGPMGDHFQFTDNWKSQTWIELGRSFISPYYQQKEKRQSFDYVLHGLGYIYAKNQHIKGYFGKVTLYYMYEKQQADAFFLAAAKKYFKASKEMFVNPDEKIPEGVLTDEQTTVLDRDIFKGLFYNLRAQYNLNLVPIMAIYNRMVDLNDMFYFGAFRHQSFGNTTEVGIAIDVKDIYEVIIEKFVHPYLPKS